MAQRCVNPLVIHRCVKRSECIDPDCPGALDDHGEQLPCQWSWQLAHGKTFNGEPFPKRRCPACAHIRRAGNPDAELAPEVFGVAK